jgi:hypothetical protein
MSRKSKEKSEYYSSTHSYPCHCFEVNGQIHAQSLYPPGRDPPLPTGRETDMPSDAVWMRWGREKSLQISGFMDK